jgi:hypothetical protein
MRKLVLTCVTVLLFAVPAPAQTQFEKEAEIRRAVPYSRMLRESPDMTWLEYNQIVREVAKKQLREDLTGMRSAQPRAYTPPPTAYTPPPTAYTPRYTYTPPAYTPVLRKKSRRDRLERVLVMKTAENGSGPDAMSL